MRETPERYFKSLPKRGSKPGLERISELLALLNEPQKGMNIIHIAGTNGKGSVSKMLEGIISAAGYKCGLFESPCLISSDEYIRVGRKPVEHSDFLRLCGVVQNAEQSMTDKPTEFEVLTAMALLYFKEQQCDIVILEACMGGRLDTTNVCPSPLLSIITDVALDHTEYLGSTVAEIASEKAGIIKRGRPTVFGGTDPEALEVIKSECEKLGSPLVTVDHVRIKNPRFSLEHTVFDFGEYKDISMPLLGAYQPKNAAVALTAAEVLCKNGLKISRADIYEGFGALRHRGRFELMRRDPIVIYDGAHNPNGAAKAAESLKIYFGEKKAALVMGVMADKDFYKMVGILAPRAERAFAVTPNNPRALPAETLAECFKAHGVPSEHFVSVAEGCRAAINYAKEKKLPVIILGSLYMYKDIEI